MPTGVVADVVGRRRSVSIGVRLIGCGFLIEGAVPVFGVILLAQLVWGVGETFTSGAREAWLADEVGPERVEPVLLRGVQVGRAAGVLGIGASVALASVRLNLLILIGGGLFVALGRCSSWRCRSAGSVRSPAPSARRGGRWWPP